MSQITALAPEELVGRLGLDSTYRGRQIFRWIHRRKVFDFKLMSDLPLALRERLGSVEALLSLKAGQSLQDTDGTLKVALELEDGAAVEAVLMEDRAGRRTACLSTQVGCGMGCLFCRTGQLGFKRNLTAYELVEQLLELRAGWGEVDNLVFMGMGEPLANLENLRRAVKVFNHAEGLGMSLRRMTLSTCGLAAGIRSLAAAGPPLRLALSLVSADPRLREQLMPISRRNPLPEVRRALLDYQKATGKRITLEIVLMEGVNDRPEDVRKLLEFVRGYGADGLKVMVNLIPWNRTPGYDFREPSGERLQRFSDQIQAAGIAVTTRLKRGRGVTGACGQLGSSGPARP